MKSLASSAACQRFHFLPAAIISHGKNCLQAAGKNSLLLLSDTYHPPACKQRCLPAISFLASSNYFSWQDLLASSWQEVDSAPLRHISPPFLQAALLASDFISCQQLARSHFCSSPTHITPLLASSAACQRF